MTASQFDVDLALRDGGGVILRRDHPELGGCLDWMLRTDLLTAVLPGAYARPEQARTFETRVKAASLRDPDLVFTGATAARLSFWPQLDAPMVTAAAAGKRRMPGGFALARRTIPPELVTLRGGVRITAPALTALDLCEHVGGDGIDQVLRSRQATLAGLHEALALTGCRSGNRRRRTLLLESRAEPWSRAEREGHKLLHAEGIDGWQANFPLEVHGVVFYLDVAFPRLRLAVEIDGWEHHSSREAFESDRWRQNEIVLAGWRVLRFTWDMLVNQPSAVLAQLRWALAV